MKLGQFVGESCDQVSRRQAALIAHHLGELESVDYRLSAHVVVGEDEASGGVLLEVLDARLPFDQLIARRRKENAARPRADPMPRTPDALQRYRNRSSEQGV